MPIDGEHHENESRYLLVRSGGFRCAIPVAATKVVRKAPTVFPLPGSAPRLLGLARVAGEPVAVVDLNALLDSASGLSGVHNLTVVLRRPGGSSTVGLAVDEASGVITIADREDRWAHDPGWIAGRTSVEERSVAILDVERFFAEDGSR
jgi:chemotaxis signal transduction protein